MPPRRSPGRPNLTKTVHVQPPDGLNLADSASALAETDATFLTNMLRGERGLVPRAGWREWATGLGNAVRTTVPFAGSVAAKDRLFAATSAGIWDITTSGDSPTSALSFADGTGLAGWGTATAVEVLGGKYAFYADEVNGLFRYSETDDAWSAIVSGTGEGEISTDETVSDVEFDPATIAFVTTWKNRVWMVERDSARAWYLPVGQIGGAAKVINFGNRMRYGGSLVGLWSWTQSAGVSPDDYLVGISTAGDVVIYQGSDPDSASSFGIKGVWFVGSVPAGRRICTDTGGDLLILTALGIVPLSVLMSGGEKLNPSQYTTAKIQPLFASRMQKFGTLYGWELRLSPADNALLVMLPKRSGVAYEQFAMSLARRGWSTFSGLPILSSDLWRGKLYFGTADGRVCVSAGYVDGVRLDGSGAAPVEFHSCSCFSELGEPKNKQVQLLRPDWITKGDSPTYAVKARFDFDNRGPMTAPTFVAPTSGVWGAATWGVSTWGGSGWDATVGTTGKWSGATGIGQHVAIELAGYAVAYCVLVGCSVTWTTGGVL